MTLNILITDTDVEKKNPCYLGRYLSLPWSRTLLEIADMKEVPPENRIWLITAFLPDKENRLFAVWCARNALIFMANPDPRSVNAIDVAEQFAHGNATAEELDAAWDAARDAWGAAWDAARDAAWGAARGEQLKYLHDLLYKNEERLSEL